MISRLYKPWRATRFFLPRSNVNLIVPKSALGSFRRHSSLAIWEPVRWFGTTRTNKSGNQLCWKVLVIPYGNLPAVRSDRAVDGQRPPRRSALRHNQGLNCDQVEVTYS